MSERFDIRAASLRNFASKMMNCRETSAERPPMNLMLVKSSRAVCDLSDAAYLCKTILRKRRKSVLARSPFCKLFQSRNVSDELSTRERKWRIASARNFGSRLIAFFP